MTSSMKGKATLMVRSAGPRCTPRRCGPHVYKALARSRRWPAGKTDLQGMESSMTGFCLVIVPYRNLRMVFVRRMIIEKDNIVKPKQRIQSAGRGSVTGARLGRRPAAFPATLPLPGKSSDLDENAGHRKIPAVLDRHVYPKRPQTNGLFRTASGLLRPGAQAGGGNFSLSGASPKSTPSRGIPLDFDGLLERSAVVRRLGIGGHGGNVSFTAA
jgi:hypothetical protein